MDQGFQFGRLAARAKKLLRLLARPRFAAALARHRVAAAVEHLEPIRLTRAATLIDIGANKGQFSLAFRAVRPDAAIIAFEPLAAAADTFHALLPDAILYRIALAGAEGEADFHVTDRSDSSSLLPPGPGQSEAFGVVDERVIKVPVRRLDACVALADAAHPILIKIDVQGAELQVLEGCGDLEAVDFIYVELSFVELYEGQPLFREVSDYLAGRGFTRLGVFNQVETERFGPTQADFLFGRDSLRS
jgi:FkbM family methyltransferase